VLGYCSWETLYRNILWAVLLLKKRLLKLRPCMMLTWDREYLMKKVGYMPINKFVVRVSLRMVVHCRKTQWKTSHKN